MMSVGVLTKRVMTHEGNTQIILYYEKQHDHDSHSFAKLCSMNFMLESGIICDESSASG